MSTGHDCGRCGGCHAEDDLNACAESLTYQLRLAREVSAELIVNLSEVLSELTASFGIPARRLDIRARVEHA